MKKIEKGKVKCNCLGSMEPKTAIEKWLSMINTLEHLQEKMTGVKSEESVIKRVLLRNAFKPHFN